MPMDKSRFFQMYYNMLTGYERTEIENLPQGTVVYYAGDIP